MLLAEPVLDTHNYCGHQRGLIFIMSMDPFVDYLDATLDLGGWVLQRNGVLVDNFIFFLHYRISVTLFFSASILVTTGLYVANPIQCISDTTWILDVIDSYCWVHSTFTIPRHWNSSNNGQEKELTPHPGVKTQSESSPTLYHSYYQWICYILAIQALMMYIPRGLWKNWECGKMKTLLALAAKHFGKNNEEKSNVIIDHLEQSLGTNRSYFYKLFFCEVLNFILVLAQMYAIKVTNFTFSDVIHYITTNDPLEREDHIAQIFPKVTKCTLKTFGPSGNIVGHDALCVLPFNVINEKIYLGMWLWLVILAIISAILLIYRILLILPAFRIMILKHSSKYTDIESFGILRKELDVGDWMLLRNLSKNLDLYQFTDVVKCLQIRLLNKQLLDERKLHLYNDITRND